MKHRPLHGSLPGLTRQSMTKLQQTQFVRLILSHHLMDARVKCMARGHPRRVFGDMTDTSSLHGIGCKEAIHAVEEGVDYGSAAGVRSFGDAGRCERSRAMSAVRDSSGHRIQVAGT